MSNSVTQPDLSTRAITFEGVKLKPGEVAARLNRLPLAGKHWVFALVMQATYGFVIAVDGSAARLYPAVWEPAHAAINQTQYTIIYMLQVGIGLMLGSMLFGFLSDKFGRKRMLVVAAATAGVFFIPVAFSMEFWVQALVGFLTAVGVGGMLAITNVYMQEMAPPKVRSRVGNSAQILSMLLSSLTVFIASWTIPANWQWYIYILAAFIILIDLPLLLWAIPESPRWLESKGKHDRAVKILERIERSVSRNGTRTLPEPRIEDTIVGQTEKVPFRELFVGAIGKNTVLLMVVWTLSYAFGVYGFYQFLTVFLIQARGMPASQAIQATGFGTLVAIVVFLIAIWIGDKLERRTAVLIGCVIQAVGVFLLFSHSHDLNYVGGMLGVGAISISSQNLYLYTAASFPTRIRTLGVSWTDGFGHNGSIWGPFAASAFFSLTTNHAVWIIACAVLGMLVPGLLMQFFGQKQSGRDLEAIVQ